jgi:4-hydroxybutyryl-CoA dehydratase/vinylacetyl-CoA-Delta-isomerase
LTVPLRDPSQYLESLHARRPLEIWFRGERIPDPTAHPVLSCSLDTVGKVYELAQDPAWQDLLTTGSPLTGERVNLYLSPLLSREHALQKTRLARALGEALGACTHRCTGSEAIAGLFPLTYDLEGEAGIPYHQRFRAWLAYAQREDLACTAALTDPKGDRRLKPHEQPEPDTYLHIAARREDGIVLRGAKVNQTGVLFAHEMLVLPTAAMDEADQACAVACAVPTDAPGLIYVLGRQPHDGRCGDEDERLDAGRRFGDHQALILFEDVFVPWERVFLAGEWAYTGRLVDYFTAVHRLTAGACKAGGMTLLTGATALAARYIGVERASHVREKMAEMEVGAETLYALSLAAGHEGYAHPSGAWVPNALLAHTCKYQTTRLPFEAMRYAREIATGWGETAPAAADLRNPEIGPRIERIFRPAVEGASAEDRLRLVRLIESLTRGSNWSAFALHGGGNPEASRLMVLRQMDWEHLARVAEAACGIEAEDAAVLEEIARRQGQVQRPPR